MSAIETNGKGNGNGFAAAMDITPTLSLLPDQDWRRECLEAAFLCASTGEGTSQHVVLAAFQKHMPHYAARVFWEDRNGAVAAFRERCTDWEELVRPAARADNDELGVKTHPVVGWWRGRPAPDAAPVELILCPDFHGNGDYVLVGPDGPTLDAFISTIFRDIHQRRTRCQRFAGGWKDAPSMEAEIARVSWDDVVLAPEVLNDIRQTVSQFFTQKAIFTDLGFPWRRGVLLVGPPGTGKTMVCKAVAASQPNLPFLYVADFGRQQSIKAEVEQVFAYARKNAPCVLAFEDVDGLVGEQNRTIFLNELDGFKNNDGLLIIASSNHPERIDEALLKRPSRFDRVYHIGLPALAERAEYCRRFLARLPHVTSSLDAEELSERVAEITEGFTPAFLKEAFLSAALQTAQEGRKELDAAFHKTVLEQVDMLRKYLKKAKDPAALADLVGASGNEIGFRAR